jgi:hypothetical protein
MLARNARRVHTACSMQLSFVLLETGADGRWHPGIGDPTFVGWLTVVAYAVGTYYSFQALRAARLGAKQLSDIAPPEAANQRDLARLWLLITAAMAFLCVNKQLDLQTFFTEVMRDMAHSEGWYNERRKLQVAFIYSIMVVGLGGTLAIAFLLRKVLSRVLGAVFGMGALASFVVIRAASFHNVDILLSTGLGWVLELGGISMIAVSAWRSGKVIRGMTG